jgi:glycosyltransferase involved in cell wall biosynthesis
MKPLVVASNMLNERHQLDEWFPMVQEIADGGIVIVDSGSNDGAESFFVDKKDKNGHPVVFITSNIIKEEGYGPARTNLRDISKLCFPKASWCLILDGDERILPCDFHTLRFLKDYLEPNWDVIALPRIDWRDKEMTQAAKDVYANPDWQGRMTRLDSPLKYVRRLHEQIADFRAIYAELENPKIHHFHRTTSQEVRDRVGILCTILRDKDEFKDTYPAHHKEAYYRELMRKEKENGGE